MNHRPVRVTSHESRVTEATTGAFLLMLFILLFSGRAAAQQPATPLIVDADQVVYDQATQKVEATGNVRLQYRGVRLTAENAVFDLQQEFLTAHGRVVLIDAEGRELRGDRLTYDSRTNQADISPGESIVNRVYVRSERIQTQRNRIIAEQSTVTTCDPQQPAYRITARQIDVIPGDRLIARSASLWIGSLRVLTLPVLRVSLRSPEETARSLPRVGYNNVDGFWIDYLYGYDLRPFQSAGFYSKYGTRSGIILRNILAYNFDDYKATLTVGRNQDKDMNTFDQTELVLSRPDSRIGSLPLFYGLSLGEGLFRESTTGVQTSRLQYSVGLRTSVIPLSPRTSWQTSISWQDAFYGTGGRQGVLRINSAITRQLDARSSLTLGYDELAVFGVTPFKFDAIDPSDLVNKVSLQYARSGLRGPAATTSFGTGVSYSFRDYTVSVNLGYGERVASRFHWGFAGEYNLGTQDLKLTTDSGLALGRGTYFTVQAIYHTSTQSFEDLDYIITSRLCDCIDISLKYRQVRQEIWLEIGLAAFPTSRLEFQFPGP